MSLKEFHTLPMPDSSLFEELNNRLVREEFSYNIGELALEHSKLYKDLNVQQKEVYNNVIESVQQNKGGLLFVYGAGGTSKTYLYKTIITRLRSEGKIVLVVASSGIASLLLLGGRTAHSRFAIPIEHNDHSTCDIRQGSHLAELIQKTSLIVWDEAPMNHRNAFEAADRTLRDILRFQRHNSNEKVFGGDTVLLGGDFRQTLLVVLKGRREDVVRASINKSHIWNSCRVFILTTNMRIQDTSDFRDWVLALGDGKLETKKTNDDNNDESWIEIPNDLLIPPGDDPIANIVSSTYPDIINNYDNHDYLKARGILTPRNETVDEINSFILDLIATERRSYLNADSICKSTGMVHDQDILYPVEFLNTLKFPGIPNHQLDLKVGITVMLLRNLNQSAGLALM